MTGALSVLIWRSSKPDGRRLAANYRGWSVSIDPPLRTLSWAWFVGHRDRDDDVSGHAETQAEAMAAAEAALWARLTAHQRAELARQATVAAWNAFDANHGRFADEWNRDYRPDEEDQ